MHRIVNVLFDLDGTLSDPREGIVNCFIAALKELQQPIPSMEELVALIGTPARETFAILMNTDRSEEIEHALALYRENFQEWGINQNILFPQIPEALRRLKQAGTQLYVATSKCQPIAEKTVAVLGIREFFTEIFGPGPDGELENKIDLIRWILDNRKMNPSETVMIGDTAWDILGGKENNLRTIGVSYGFGKSEELSAADFICQSPEEIPDAVLRRTGQSLS